MRRGGSAVAGPIGDRARLLIAGDTHGNLDWIKTLVRLAARHECDGIVQLGDFGLWPDLRIMRNEGRVVPGERFLDEVARLCAQRGVWLAFIDGNHDFHPGFRDRYPAIENGMRPLRDGVVTWLDRGSVWEWCGVRFGALGGAISIDQAHRRPRVSWWDSEAITDVEVDTLIERSGPDGVDVLLTHDGPALPPGIVPVFDIPLAADCARSVDHVAHAADALTPQLLLHGHYHQRYRHTYGSTRVEGLASDEEAGKFGESWLVLELTSLAVFAAGELQRSQQ